MRLRAPVAAALVSVLSLAACSASDSDSSEADHSFDFSGISAVDDIAALVPQKIRERGKIIIGASIDYAPANFRADDLQTAIGYDVDLGKALGRVLKVDTELSAAEFASILPGIGSKYDLGISTFTITKERTANYTMISYLSVGSSFAVKSGNPKDFNPDYVCGRSIAVQTGTYQEGKLTNLSTMCTDAGEAAVDILKFGAQSDATTNVVGGKAEAMYADSTASEYAVALTQGEVEVVGEVHDAAPQGIVVASDDTELAAAIQQAVQHLMDDGTLGAILESWGSKDAVLTTSEIFPQS